MRTSTSVGLVLAIATASFGSAAIAQLEGPAPAACRDVALSLDAVKVRPDMLVGKVSGDLDGVVSLFTLKATEDPTGRVIDSVVELTFGDVPDRNQFNAMFSIHEDRAGHQRARTAARSLSALPSRRPPACRPRFG